MLRASGSRGSTRGGATEVHEGQGGSGIAGGEQLLGKQFTCGGGSRGNSSAVVAEPRAAGSGSILGPMLSRYAALVWLGGGGAAWPRRRRPLRGGARRGGELGFGGGGYGWEEGAGGCGVRLKEGAGDLGIWAVGHAAERHGEDRWLC